MSTATEDVKAVVRQFLIDNFVMGGDLTIADDTSFMKSRILDSTGFIELITFIEDTYQIKVDDREMLPENFDSLQNVERYVDRKTRAQAAA